MSFPPLHPTSHSSIASSALQTAGAASTRSRQSPWGLSTQASTGSRSGLTPLATHNLGTASSESERRTATTTNSGSLSPSLANNASSSASPFGPPSFSAVLNANTSSRLHNLTRTTSTSASSSGPSPFSPAPQSGSQPAQQLASPRSRANTPSTSSNVTTSAASEATSQTRGGGSSGGGGSGSTARPSTFSPSLSTLNLASPTGSAFDRTPFTPSASSASGLSGQSSVSKIVVTQVFILLGSITEKEGKQKWDTQAEAIRKVCHLRHPR